MNYLKKYDEAIKKSESIILRLDQQHKEIKTLKTLLFFTVGIVIIGAIFNLI